MMAHHPEPWAGKGHMFGAVESREKDSPSDRVWVLTSLDAALADQSRTGLDHSISRRPTLTLGEDAREPCRFGSAGRTNSRLIRYD